MAKILGLGGIFFKAADPEGVKAWYARVLGFDITDWGGAMFAHPATGHTTWAPFSADTTYFEPSTASFMINLIVDDIDGVLAHARDEGVEPTGRMDESYGRFAWIMDPAGIKVELYQPLG
ncbi:VOC family protein [Asticcacaulis sp. BYS171W]|uniref:VOC family protein n=1 Tax=Asticcacaulis aquaticus TaxID=2984212 RepID=A0ABT5HP23_9CAUL|nr:VOC family protein [Asticcacaulis aquaticus]MDC7681808.1 VOC family protein [Asticcacaulis aquaticus]